MTTYFRVQPAGLGIDHYSESSSGETSDGLHVLTDAAQVCNLDVGTNLRTVRRAYGDEIVEIEAESSWANGDVEGECVDPTTAKIVARYTWAQWLTRVLGREIKRATESTYAEARRGR